MPCNGVHVHTCAYDGFAVSTSTKVNVTFESLSTTFKASMNVSFDTGLLIFVTDIHLLVVVH